MSGDRSLARDEVRHLVFYVELPFRLPHRPGLALCYDDDAPVLRGWESFSWGDYLGAENPDPGLFRRATWIVFKDGDFVMSPPIALALAAFSELRNALPELDGMLAHQRRTVVQLHRFVTPPSTVDDAWYEAQLHEGLSRLDGYLIGVAFARNSHDVRPLSAADLPYAIAMLEGDPWEVTAGRSRLRYRPIFNRVSSNATTADEEFELSREDAEFAQAIAGMFGPLVAAAELIIRARTGVYSEAHRQAVLDAGTGVELLVGDVLNDALQCGLLGAPEQAQLRDLQRRHRYAEIVRRSFAPLCSFDPEPRVARDELGDWWRDGYRLRNKVAHEGHVPSAIEAARAAGAAEALFIATWRVYTQRKATRSSSLT